MSKDKDLTPKLSRRSFIAAAGGGAPLTAAAAAAITLSASEARAQGEWAHEADVIVVGTGAAGCAAALRAGDAGASVLMIEKGAGFGGTTALSGGVIHIPNNAEMKAAGIVDAREDCLRFYARTAYADQYQPNAERFGLAQNEYELIAAFYDEGAATMDRLAAQNALQTGPYLDFEGKSFPDYYSQVPENKAPRGRGILPRRRSDGAPVISGVELIAQLKAALDKRETPILLRRRAIRLVMDEGRRVIGLEAEATDPVTGAVSTVRLRARRGVVFASGGFTHNREMRTQLRGPVFAGCGPATNEGDFVTIAGAVGAKLSNMANAWWYPQVLELALRTTATGLTGGNPGDSMLVVNKHGERVLNEKVRYADRAQAHFHWDTALAEYRNLVLFMVFDQRTRDLWAQRSPIPSAGANPSWLLSAPTLAGLGQVIDKRLAELGDQITVRLAPDFDSRLARTVRNFNGYARTGVDPEFRRGESMHERSFHGPRAEGNDMPNATMYPLAAKGPYYAVMLCGGTLDTKGGPKINAKAEVLDWADRPIAGLYGAGNCIGSPAGQAYWGAGGTIGPALVFGAIAGREAAAVRA